MLYCQRALAPASKIRVWTRVSQNALVPERALAQERALEPERALAPESNRSI